MRAHPAGPRHGDVVNALGAPQRPDSVEVMHELHAAVWSRTVTRDASGCVTVAGRRVSDLVQAFGSPLYVLDEVDFRERAAAYRDAYDGCDVYYAAKAFLATAIARWAIQEGLRIDVATGGELAVAVRAGVPGSSILFHGNNKSASEIEYALDSGVGRIVVDSMQEIERVGAAAARRGVIANVLIRVTVGVEAHTHEFIATAHEDQKFGLSLAGGAAEAAVRAVVADPALRLVGLHSHIGSQIFDAAGFEVAAGRVIEFAGHLHNHLGVRIGEINLGGGMGIAYTPDDDPLDIAQMAAAIRTLVAKACAASGVEQPHLAVEPGRAIVGPAGMTIYEVGTVKPVLLGHGHVRTYVSVDGGMSDNIRTALYDADYTVTLASRVSSAEPMLVRIVGKHCESGDVVVRDAWLPSDLAPGDLLAVAATGAYCRSMASQYNYVPRPAVIAVRDGDASIVLRRETEDDLLALDPGA